MFQVHRRPSWQFIKRSLYKWYYSSSLTRAVLLEQSYSNSPTRTVLEQSHYSDYTGFIVAISYRDVLMVISILAK